MDSEIFLDIINTASILVLFFLNPPRLGGIEEVVVDIALPHSKFQQWLMRRKMNKAEFISPKNPKYKFLAYWYLLKYKVIWIATIGINLLVLIRQIKGTQW
jgi:hypothetical protein